MGKHIAFIVIDNFADWEHAQLSAAARTYFDGATSFHTPGGRPVTSMGGMTIDPARQSRICGPRPMTRWW